MTSRVGVLVARAARMRALLEELSAGPRRLREVTGPGPRELVSRGCACGASLRALVPAAAVVDVNAAWTRGHARPGCSPVSAVAAFELRHERASWWAR